MIYHENIKIRSCFGMVTLEKKVRVGKDQEKGAIRKKIPTPKTEVGKNQTNNQLLIP